MPMIVDHDDLRVRPDLELLSLLSEEIPAPISLLAWDLGMTPSEVDDLARGLRSDGHGIVRTSTTYRNQSVPALVLVPSEGKRASHAVAHGYLSRIEEES